MYIGLAQHIRWVVERFVSFQVDEVCVMFRRPVIYTCNGSACNQIIIADMCVLVTQRVYDMIGVVSK